MKSGFECARTVRFMCFEQGHSLGPYSFEGTFGGLFIIIRSIAVSAVAVSLGSLYAVVCPSRAPPLQRGGRKHFKCTAICRSGR